MKKGNLIITLLLGLVFFSCDKDKKMNPDPEPEVVYSIIGEWKWLETNGGYDGCDYFTPENTGNTLSLTFIPNGQVIIIENLDTTFVTDYFVTKVENEPKDYLTINCEIVYSKFGTLMLPAQYYIYSLTDTLILYEASWSDGYGHWFKRVSK